MDLDSKRFQRYVERVKDYIYHNYLLASHPRIFANDAHYNNLEMIVTSIFQKGFIEHVNGKAPDFLFFAPITQPYVLNPLLTKLDFDIVEEYLMDAENQEPDSFSTLFQKSCEQACIDFICDRSLILGNINDKNYFQTLPACIEDALFIYSNIINRLYINVCNVCMTKSLRYAMNHWVNTQHEAKYQDLEATHQNALSVVDELNQQIDDQKKTILTLTQQLNQQKSVSNIAKDDELQSYLIMLERKNAKLTQMYERIADKYQQLKVSTDNDTAEEVAIDIRELDMNGNYLFVAHNKASFQKNILELFPNAKFYTLESTHLNLADMNVDMVVCVTAHINHSMYDKVKGQCLTFDVPLVHCKYTNANLIKETMWNYLNPQIIS